jgi:hypothetical protein
VEVTGNAARQPVPANSRKRGREFPGLRDDLRLLGWPAIVVPRRQLEGMGRPPLEPSAIAKLESALPGILGRTIARAVVIMDKHPGERWQVHFEFTDGTEYELYGAGWVNGTRGVGSAPWNGAIESWLAARGATWQLVVPPVEGSQ